MESEPIQKNCKDLLTKQNEMSETAAKGFGLLPHREPMVKEDLEEKFKNAANPFRLVFVFAMWLTGPSDTTLHLDKTLRGDTRDEPLNCKRGPRPHLKILAGA